MWDESDGTTYEYERLWAYEFRYDGGRERYLARRLNPANPDPHAPGGIMDETWMDYDLDGSVYGDYQVAVGGAVTELKRYVPGLAQQSVATGAAEYFLGDQIGTTRLLTDESAPVAATNRRVYTAFGELVEMIGSGCLARTRISRRSRFIRAHGLVIHDRLRLPRSRGVPAKRACRPAVYGRLRRRTNHSVPLVSREPVSTGFPASSPPGPSSRRIRSRRSYDRPSAWWRFWFLT